jgi:hypothetical protein
MKTSMDDKGKITIKPEDNVESYALEKWDAENDSGNIIIKTKTEEPYKGFNSKKGKD